MGVNVHRPGEDELPGGVDDFGVGGMDAPAYFVDMTVPDEYVALKYALLGCNFAVAKQRSHCKSHLSFVCGH